MASTAWPSISREAAGIAHARAGEAEAEAAAARRPGRAWFLGRVGYLHAARLQHALVAERVAGRAPDTFLLLEHPPVITLGRGAHAEHLLAGPAVLRAAGAEVWETSRGGDITYHGPGQLVGYGILDLREHGRDVARYLRDLEQALIGVLAELGIEGGRRPGLTGVWVGERKVAAIGVRAERWVTSHGFALNVDPDLGHFAWIVPCGIRDRGVTSIGEILRARGRAEPVPSLAAIAESARRRLGEVFGLDLEPQEASTLEGLALPEGAPLGGIVRRDPAEGDTAAEGS